MLALSILLMLSTAATRGQDEVDLANLTVPQERLAPGCELSPSPTVPLGGRVPKNPWTGAERSIVADVREHVAASPRLPDGPPLSRSELARFRAQLAEDVDQAYAAVYTAGTHLITVSGVRFKAVPVPDPPRGMSPSAGSVRLVRGRTVIAVFGEGGRCFDAIAAYLTEVTAR